MSEFLWDPVEGVMNGNLLRIVDAGPLRTPINSFVLRRKADLGLALETQIAQDAVSQVPESPSGTLRMNDAIVRWDNGFGFEVLGKGVVSHAYSTSNDLIRDKHSATETSALHSVEATFPHAEAPVYTIDWLENVDSSWFIWPHTIKRERTTAETRTIGHGPDEFTVIDQDTRNSMGSHCVKVKVGDIEVHLCARWLEPGDRHRKPGCLIYRGTPDDHTQKRIRNVLSFSLGMFLVSLGHTVYSADWRMVSFRAISSYSIDGRVFDLPVLPPVPLAARSNSEIDPARLNRLASALYAAYDELEFGDLNWGFWHARCATPHIAPVHFGAIIEALQKVCADRFSEEIATKIIDDGETWTKFFDEVKRLAEKLEIPEDRKPLLQQAAGRMNGMPHQAVMESILNRMKLQFGKAEKTAWRRRNDAAHGRAIPQGSELEAIRDAQYLHGLFDRMLLKLVNASDSYIDYSTPKHPIRPLAEAPTPPF
ncbi:hypothetical protein AB8A31_06730 [Tardiphaga sp. 804_B3_N1_9]|uniref:hypothetical protein n=1 Tax=Tardiphaga sp. 804_B3_N1_9 TaxID=3240786 RepID=UPI003F2286E2